MKGKKGITLLAVIITVIIMLILVSVVVDIVMDGALFDKTKGALGQYDREGDRERLEALKEAERIEGYKDPENDPYPDVDDYFDRLVDEGVIEDKEEAIIDNGDDTYELTTNEDNVFKITETDDEILIDIIGDAKTLGPRIIEIIVKNKTTNSVEIEVKGKRLEGVTYIYEYKKETEEQWKEAGRIEENTYTYTGLEANEIYNIRVKAENKKGSSEKETSVRTGELPTGTINFGDTKWAEGEASVIITNKAEEFEIEYQVNGIEEGKWTKVENGGEIRGLEHNDTIYARITDGTNHGEYASADIQDKTNPQVTVTAGTTTSNSIAVNVTASDNESGMASSLTYTYYIKATTGNTYEQKASNGNASYTFTGLTQGITYDIKVEVQGDNAGNKGAGTTQATTGTVTSGTTTGAITFGSTTWSSNKASITISTNTSYTIEYQVNSISGQWTTITNGGKVTGLNHGDTVYARLTDGTNAGDYASTSIEDKTAPNVTVNKGTTTSNSIRVSVTASDGQSGMASSLTYTYYIKATTGNTYEQKASNGNASYTFTGLTQGITYDIKVEVQGDNAGNKGAGTTQATTGTVTSGTTTGAITFGSTTWSSNKASITISTNTSYTIEYQVNSISGQWTTIANGGKVTNLNHGDTVYARLTDGINAGQHASASITDGIAPTISSFTVTTYDTTSITVSAKATDNQSGIYSYQFQYKLSTASSYTTATTTVTSNGTCTYKYTGLADDTTYNLRVIVTDKAGKTSNKTATQKTVDANVAPVISSAAFSSKTTSSITVTARATDENGDRLTYRLYTSTSQNGTYTQKATTSANQSSTVTLNATGLSNYTTYWWYVQVSDGEETRTSSKQSVRTYCPGTGYTCYTSSCPGTQTISCTSCGGDGEVSERCTDGYTSSCSSCGGDGEVSERCSGGSSRRCTTCGGDGRVPCTGSPSQVGSSNYTTCSKCGKKTYCNETWRCRKCGTTGYVRGCDSCGYNSSSSNNHSGAQMDCTRCDGTGDIETECSHGYINSHTIYEDCSRCDGTGEREYPCIHGYTRSHTVYEDCYRCNGRGTITTTPCTHGYSSSHRHCTHYTTTTRTSHSYCSHGKTSQHD